MILLLLLLILFLPFSFSISYEERFVAKAYFCGVRLFSTEKPKSKKDKNSKPKKPEKKEKKPNVFNQAKEKLGASGAIKYFAEIAKMAMKKLGFAFKHLKFRKFRLFLSVGASDAAETAIRYGEVCTAVYPALSTLFSICKIKGESVDISADFNSGKIKFGFSAVIRAQLIFFLIAALGGLIQYKKIKDVSFDE